MAASDRQQVQQQLKQPDPFFEAIAEAREYFENNRTKVLATVGGAISIFVLVFGMTSYWVSEGQRAASDFASAVSNLQFDSPSAAEADLKILSGRANAGPYKPLASLYSAGLAADAERYDESIAAYDKFLESPPTDYMKQIGLMGKASALERAGKKPEAAAVLDQASAIQGPYRKAALEDRARLAEDAGDKATAIANLQKVLEIDASGPGAASIEQRIQSLK